MEQEWNEFFFSRIPKRKPNSYNYQTLNQNDSGRRIRSNIHICQLQADTAIGDELAFGIWQLRDDWVTSVIITLGGILKLPKGRTAPLVCWVAWFSACSLPATMYSCDNLTIECTLYIINNEGKKRKKKEKTRSTLCLAAPATRTVIPLLRVHT
jgi:hypothetical protein